MPDEIYSRLDDEPLTDDELWAVGLFEGEGCLSILGTTSRWPQAKVFLSTTDEDVVRRFHAAVGIGTVREDRSQERYGYQRQWRWQIGSQNDVDTFIGRYLHLFGQRRRLRAYDLLALLETKTKARICMQDALGEGS